MNAMSLRKMIVAIALVGISASYVRADKMQLQEKLSKDVSINLKDVTIAEALEKIGQKAGVKIVLSDEAAWKLPQGQATRLSVSLDGPLADSITEMLNAFFMRYAVGDEEITIYPLLEMEHILGRPTTKQLELLKAIYTRPIKVYYLDQVQKTINQALGQEILISPIHIQLQLNTLLHQLAGKEPIYDIQGRPVPTLKAVVKPPEPNEPESTKFDLPTPVTLVQLLSQVNAEDQYRNEKPAYWYISGMDFSAQSPEIHVVNRWAFSELQLNQKIDISYKDEPANKILQDLASWAGAQLFVEPQSHLQECTLSVKMQNITISQAVRNIADMIGAGCKVDVGGQEGEGYITISGPGSKTKVTPAPTAAKTTSGIGSDGYVGKISIPMDGGKYFLEFMLRESDLTEELKKLRTERMKEVLGVAPEVKPAQTQIEK